MSRWIARRYIVLLVTHLAAVMVGLAGTSVLVPREPREAWPALLDLASAWTTSPPGGCAADMAPWARRVVARRTNLAEDDFAIEAAVALRLLRDEGLATLNEQDRHVLTEGAERCPAVLHEPCNGDRFDRAVRVRCGALTRRRLRRDGGKPCPDAGSEDD